MRRRRLYCRSGGITDNFPPFASQSLTRQRQADQLESGEGLDGSLAISKACDTEWSRDILDLQEHLSIRDLLLDGIRDTALPGRWDFIVLL